MIEWTQLHKTVWVAEMPLPSNVCGSVSNGAVTFNASASPTYGGFCNDCLIGWVRNDGGDQWRGSVTVGKTDGDHEYLEEDVPFSEEPHSAAANGDVEGLKLRVEQRLHLKMADALHESWLGSLPPVEDDEEWTSPGRVPSF